MTPDRFPANPFPLAGAMTGSKLQSNRHELKYLVDEPKAQTIRQFVMSYLEPDAHTPPEGGGYAVHSLYLDTPDRLLCQATQHGLKNRFKLRVRFYDEVPENPVFFEIKRRVTDVILKQRAAVRRSSVPHLLAGDWPGREDLFIDDDRNFRALYNFCTLRSDIGAQPSAYTSYLREGYEPPDSNDARVTFDRQIRGQEFRGSLSVKNLKTWQYAEIPGVILELKFTGRFPNWMHTLVEHFNLVRTSVPKYVKCVEVVEGIPHRQSSAALASLFPA